MSAVLFYSIYLSIYRQTVFVPVAYLLSYRIVSLFTVKGSTLTIMS